jgi:hypothetical protein
MIMATSAVVALLAFGSVSAGKSSSLSSRRVKHDKKVPHTAHTIDEYLKRRRAGKTSKEVLVNHKDLILESDTGNLRGLSQKDPNSRDNFLLLSLCADSECNDVLSQWGILVNYCFNWGENAIFMIKMNKKEVCARCLCIFFELILISSEHHSIS